jgi:hypothetical protein
MLVKVFDIKEAKNIEREIQHWLDRNPGIKIHTMSQSSAEDSTGWYYQVIVIYSR